MPQLSQFDTHMHTRFTHTRIIQHTKTFSCQPVICAIKYCMKINFHDLHNHTQPRVICHHKILHTLMIQHMKTFSRQPFRCTMKYWKKTVTIYTTTHTHFMRHFKLLYITKFSHQSDSIQKYIPSSCITLPLGLIRIKLIQK